MSTLRGYRECAVEMFSSLEGYRDEFGDIMSTLRVFSAALFPYKFDGFSMTFRTFIMISRCVLMISPGVLNTHYVG